MEVHVGHILQWKRMGWGNGAEMKEKKGGWIRKNQRGDFFFLIQWGK